MIDYLNPQKAHGNEALAFSKAVVNLTKRLNAISDKALDIHPDQAMPEGAEIYIDLVRELSDACSDAIEDTAKIADSFSYKQPPEKINGAILEQVNDRLWHVIVDAEEYAREAAE